jgi:hypothetical protein
VARAVGPTPGPNVERPTGATPSEEGVVRPTGPTFGFTFRPLLQEPFRPGDRIPRFDAEQAGRERTDLSTEAFILPPRERFDMLIDMPPFFDGFRFDLIEPFRFDLLGEERLDLLIGPSGVGPFRPDLSTEAPPEVIDPRFDLLTDPPSEAPPVVLPPPIGPIVGGTFTGGMVGSLASWLLDADYWLGEWRLFEAEEYQAEQLSSHRPLRRDSALADREWTVSGYANVGPGWSALREGDRRNLRQRAGHGPEWSALMQR